MNAAPALSLPGDPGGFSDLARHFARLLCELDGGGSRELALAAALASREVDAGHVCADLAVHAGAAVPGAPGGERFPPLGPWVARLRESGVVGAPGEFCPLVLDKAHRLYLYRYWEYERDLAQGILQRARRPVAETGAAAPAGGLADGLARLFPGSPPEQIDWQRVAALAAATRKFCVISGGPGTGKTHTVVKVLALVIELGMEPAGERAREIGRPLRAAPRIALAAPTGKAAARLKEAVGRARAALPCSEAVRGAIPEDVSTLHHLLGATGNGGNFRHGPDHPLPFDAVVVDEASMVDLPLMARLFRALPPEARLILLGDKDQLASVEAGAVLGDICAGEGVGTYSEAFGARVRAACGDTVPVGPGPAHGEHLRDAIVVLQKSYRFGAHSGIGAVSRAVNRGEGDEALARLAGGFPDASWRDVGQEATPDRALRARVLPWAAGLAAAQTPAEALERLGGFQILCALRQGPWGAEAVNAAVERALADAGLTPGRRWYRGRPVLVTRNDYSLRLFNGDLGVAFPDPDAGGDLRVFFPTADGTVRSVAPSRLPEHETAWALTVHKAQGSEFDEVLLVLGVHPSRVLTRELVYTGLTRARSRVEVWGAAAVFREAVSRRVERSSGLRDALWGSGGARS